MNKQIALPHGSTILYSKNTVAGMHVILKRYNTILTKILILSKTTSGPISRVVLQKDIVS